MLSYEWKELESVTQRLERLREQYDAASREGGTNIGVIEGLKRDVIATTRQHDQLVAHISKALVSSAAA